MAAPDVSIRIGADLAEIKGALADLKNDFADVGKKSRAALANNGASEAGAQLKALSAQAKNFAGLIGVTVGLQELIRLADTYSQMNARLRLATKASGDFAAVQASLIKTARDTRAPLADTVNLYSQIAPSLDAVGIGSQRTVGVITTVNQAIALSGASAQAAEAALTQFNQGLASGTLRGEELNSILEQTPALAQAIADGLGVGRGELRKLGEEGQLTAEKVALALEKVAKRVASDFGSVPVTVSQATTLASNSILLVVGRFDEATGASGALSRAILNVASGVENLAVVGETLAPVFDVIFVTVDTVARAFRMLGTSIAATTLAVQQALTGDIQGALATMQEAGDRVLAIYNEVDQIQARRQGAGKNLAVSRLEIEEKIADQLVKLDQLRRVESGKSDAAILKSAKELETERTKIAEAGQKERIKAEEDTARRLIEGFRESAAEARKATEEAGDIRTKGKDKRTSLEDKAAERRNRGLSDSERSDLAERAASNLTAQATLAAGSATSAARDGDLTRATKLAADAAKLAARAESAADKIADDDTAARALEELGRVQQKIAEAEAKAKEGEAAQFEKVAASQLELIAQSEARLVALKAEAEKPITLSADITAAEAKIAELRTQLDGITDKTVTVTVNTVQAGQPEAAAVPVQALATGGKISGPGTETSDSILIAGSRNEWMINARASRHYGDAFMHRLNTMQIPRFAEGGRIDGAAYAAQEPAADRTEPAIFKIPGLGDVPVQINRAVAESLSRALRIEATKAGRR
jgi:tape measure domain-containing protein